MIGKFLAILVLTAIAWPAIAHPSGELRLQVLNERIDADPTNPALLLLRARELIHEEQWQFAEQDLLNASQLAGNDYVSFDLGLLNLVRQDFHAAAYYFKQHLESPHPNVELALWHLSKISLELKNQPAALAYFDAYLIASKAPHPGNIARAVRTASNSGQVELALGWLELGIEKVGPVPQLMRLKEELRFATASAEIE